MRPQHGLAFALMGIERGLTRFYADVLKLDYRDKSAPFIEDIFGDSDEQLFSRISTNSLHIIQQ